MQFGSPGGCASEVVIVQLLIHVDSQKAMISIILVEIMAYICDKLRRNCKHAGMLLKALDLRKTRFLASYEWQVQDPAARRAIGGRSGFGHCDNQSVSIS
jgi:hypothetical protein